MAFASLLNQTAIVYRYSVSTDEIGAESRSLALSSTTPCRIRQLSATERLVGAQVSVAASHRMYCDAGASILATDVVLVGSNYYHVVAVNNVNLADRHQQIDLIGYEPERQIEVAS